MPPIFQRMSTTEMKLEKGDKSFWFGGRGYTFKDNGEVGIFKNSDGGYSSKDEVEQKVSSVERDDAIPGNADERDNTKDER
ncbi:MAG: hypothetical protein ACR2QF_01790 [Geminicoccaceae bacterium]